MKSCKKSDLIIAYLDRMLDPNDALLFEDHINICPFCQEEIAAYKRTFEILDADEVPVPEPAYFDRLKTAIRQNIIRPGQKTLWTIVKVLVPVAAVLILFVVLHKPKGTVEMSVDVSSIIQDENFNNMLLGKIIDDRIVEQFNALEDYYASDIEENIGELSSAEKTEFIKRLSAKYNKI